MVSGPFVTDKIKQLVLFDCPSHSATELVVNQLGFVAHIELGVVNLVRPGLQMVVGVVFEQRPVHLVRSTLSLEVNSSAACQTLFSIIAVGDNIDLLKRFKGGNVGDHVRQQDVIGADTVNASIVLIVAGAVDVELECSRRVAGDGV